MAEIMDSANMDIEFVIPLSREDLLQPKDCNYMVRDIYPPIELPEKLKECHTLRKDEGSAFILKTFDTLYSVLNQFPKLDFTLREEAWEIIFTGVAQHGSELCLLLDDNNELDSVMKDQHVNILKMLTYLLCQMTELFEAEATKQQPDAVVNIGKGKRKQSVKKSNGNCSEDWDWDEMRDKCLHCLSQLCMLPLNKLFDPPVVEEEYVNLVCKCCYKLLENPAIGRLKSTKDSIFNLLGIHLKKNNHAASCSLTIIQLLRHFEHLVSLLAYGVGLFVNNYGAKTIINDIIREIGRMDDNDLSRDNAETRSYSQFLVEIAQQMPELVLPTISLLIPHLNGDAYSMRNCVLEVMGEIVLKVLSDSNLDDKSRNLRNEFLDRLEDHVHDVNAFVRCRTIQIWNKLCGEKVIPLPRQQQVFSLIVGRLEDKSCNVRKNSIQALTTFLESNPFAAKLPLEELETSLAREMKKLEDVISSQSSEECVTENQPKELWKSIEPEVISTLQDVLQGESCESSDDVESLEDMLLTEVLTKIRSHLYDKKLRLAVKLLLEAMKIWPDYKLFSGKSTSQDETEVSNADDASVTDVENSSMADEKSQDENNSMESNGDAETKVRHVEILKELLLSANNESKMDDRELQTMSKDVLAVAENILSQDDSQKNEDIIVGGVVFNELNKQQVLVQYLKDCVAFAKQVNKAIPIVCNLLGSKTNSDVLEGIQFFVTAFEFGVQNVLTGVRKMLLLIWSKQNGIKEAVVNAYKCLYLNPQGQNERSKALAIVTNLTLLMQDLTLGEMTSLEELIAEFMKSQDLSKHVIQVLWERFSLKLANTTFEESLAALRLLSMAASAEVAIIGSNVDVLIAMGLGERAKENFILVGDTCKAFMKLAVPIKTETKDESVRFAENNEIFIRLADITVEGVTKVEDTNWVPMVDQAVAAIYKLAERPDHICSDILSRLAKVALASRLTQNGINKEEDEAEDGGEPGHQLASEILSRVIFFAGQVALHQLVHLELNIASELKRRHFLREEIVQKKSKDKRRVSSRFSSVTTPRNKDKSGSDTMEDEMGLTGAVAEDADAELLRRICETEIVTGSNLLATVAPLIVFVCSNPTKFKCLKLRAAAVLALAKFMLISSEFCEQHLPLLFTILEKSHEELIRANTIISLGDLSFRFPNLIEPWTPHLYGRLRDESVHVRKNTLMVLTYLILNDMVKVKGQTSDIALCIIDEDVRISSLARLFFSELAEKGNSVYNILPDIISRLSDPSNGVSEENFKTIQEFLFSFIMKDRQVECLVEKLCHRFRATNSERQWRDISYCLSLLTFGEKCVKKLLENLSCFSDKLGEAAVYECFVNIISNAKKISKVENKVLLEEFEQKLEEAHQKAVGENEILEKAQIAKSQSVKFEPKSPTSQNNPPASVKKLMKSSRKVRESLMERNTDMDDFHSAKKERVSRQSHLASSKKMKQITFSSDEDEENDPGDSDLSSSRLDSSIRKSARTPVPKRQTMTEPSKSSRKSKAKAKNEAFKVPSVKSETRTRSTRAKGVDGNADS